MKLIEAGKNKWTDTFTCDQKVDIVNTSKCGVQRHVLQRFNDGEDVEMIFGSNEPYGICRLSGAFIV